MASKSFNTSPRTYCTIDENEEWVTKKNCEGYNIQISDKGMNIEYDSYGGSGPVGGIIPMETLVSLLEKKIDFMHYAYHLDDDCRCPKDDQEKASDSKFDEWVRTKVNEWMNQ
jgi:hypothetical protein